MEHQLIVIVTETNHAANTDYQYIHRYIKLKFGSISNDTSLKPVYMKTKSRYCDKGVNHDIQKKINGFDGMVHIIFFIDIDGDKNYSAKALNDQIFEYCSGSPFEGATTDLGWFNLNVEDVFLGHTINDSDKTKEANKFIKSGTIDKLTSQQTDAANSEREFKRRSNIHAVLSKYLK